MCKMFSPSLGHNNSSINARKERDAVEDDVGSDHLASGVYQITKGGDMPY